MLLTLLVAARPLLMVHVMPWFAAPPVGKEWGWHWTMGKTEASKGELASHFHPVGGAYDSSDPDVIERQSLLMKIAGFDGMLVDWYGDRDRYDYLPNHRVTQKLFEACGKTGLSFALVYEDQTVPNLISGGVFKKEDAVAEGKALFARAARAWFGSPVYQKVDGKPLLMVFGPQYYREDAWAGMLPSVSFYTLHHRRASAVGAYDWPLPQGGDADSWTRRAELAHGIAIPVAYPRFQDFYKAAGIGPGYGQIDDAGGKTYERTLSDAIGRGSAIVQVATWNDWGEGTQIEPSTEFGNRDLETTQRARRKIDPSFKFAVADLELPYRLFSLRKRGVDAHRLDAVAQALGDGQPALARVELGKLWK